jgi:hypothetical protein
MGHLSLDKLKPHQQEALPLLIAAMNRSRTTIDLSSMGVGKTYLACAALRMLDLPTLVVAPKVSITSWHRVAEYFEDKHSVINYEKLRTGRTPFGWWDNTPPPGWEREEYYTCQCCQRPVDLDDDNYDPCYCHPLGIHCIITKKRKWEYGNFHFHPAVECVVFDEVHKCGAINSLNAKMLIAAKREGRRIHGMSATVGLSPLNMQALGYACNLHNLDDRDGLGFYQWARRHGCVNDRRFGGFVWLQGAEQQRLTMKTLGEQLIPRLGVRLRAEDIPGFPECDISAELYDLEESSVIDEIYQEMSESLAALARKQIGDVAPDSPLTQILRARQRMELLKVPILVELARDHQAKGYSVVIGVNFQQTLNELRVRLGWTCFIDGTPAGVKLRQKNIDDFQSNKETGMLMNIKAGGISVSLQDLHGDHPRVGFGLPSHSAVDMIQFFGRLPREGAKTKSHYRLVLVAKSLEEQIFRKFNVKRNNLQALNDQDLVPDNIAVSSGRG